jgi:hypothetical protein
MSCGIKYSWREPDIQTLIERYGQAEHLAVQIDFQKQDILNQIEYSIPQSSKTKPGIETGFADIVSLNGRKIWEIKPRTQISIRKGIKEVERYVSKAKEFCGGTWIKGVDYHTSNPDEVVFSVGEKDSEFEAKLKAKQDVPGIVVYWWEFYSRKGNKKANEVDLGLNFKLLYQLLHAYITRKLYEKGKDAEPRHFEFQKEQKEIEKIAAGKNEFAYAYDRVVYAYPYIKWKNITDNPKINFHHDFEVYKHAMKEMFKTASQRQQPEGAGIAMIIPERVFQKIQAANSMARTLSYLKVNTKPILSQSPITLLVQGAYKERRKIGLLIGGVAILTAISILIVVALPEAGVVAAVVEVGEAGTIASTATMATGETAALLARLGATVAANDILIKVSIAAGASLVAFGFEDTAYASGTSPAQASTPSMEWCIPTLKPYSPSDASNIQLGGKIDDMVVIGDLRL